MASGRTAERGEVTGVFVSRLRTRPLFHERERAASILLAGATKPNHRAKSFDVWPMVLMYDRKGQGASPAPIGLANWDPKRIKPLNEHQPTPIGTASVILPPDLIELTERLAENAHDLWAAQRLKDDWTYGPQRDDKAKKHPCLVPYAQLPESEKEYDRVVSVGILKSIHALGYRVERDATLENRAHRA